MNAELGSAPVKGWGSGRYLAFVVGIGCGIDLVSLPLNVSPVDALIICVMAFAGASWMQGHSRGWNILAMSLPWLWLILVGSILGLVFAAEPSFGAVQLLRDIYAFFIFYAVYTWVDAKPHVFSALVNGLFSTAFVCATLVLVSSELRPAGTFSNPNYAAHFMAGVLIFMLFRAQNRRLLFLLVPIILLAILKTASFGGLSMLLGAAVFGVWTGVSTRSGILRVGLRTLLVATLVGVVTTGAGSSLSASERAEELGLTSGRLDNSSDTRFEIWSTGLALVPEYPLGVGPGSVRNQDLALRDHELHNDPLAYLVERGAIGLVGLIGLITALWRSFPPHGIARVMLFAFMLGSMTRETLNYRHLWILLALALCADLGTRIGSGAPGKDRRCGAKPPRQQLS